MIKVSIKIGNGNANDSYETYGFIYVSADHRYAAPYKDMEKTSYPEEEGEYIFNKVVDEAFDYKVKFLVDGSGESGASILRVNDRITAFNNAVSSLSNGVRTLTPITLYNPSRKVKIVGYAKPIDSASDFWITSKGIVTDAAMVELTIRVNKPSLCDFNYTE